MSQAWRLTRATHSVFRPSPRRGTVCYRPSGSSQSLPSSALLLRTALFLAQTMRQRQEYIPLSTGSPSHPDRDGDIGLYGPRKDGKHTPYTPSMRSSCLHSADSHGRLMLWATIGVVLTTLLSSTLLVLGPDRSSREASVVTHDQPNPYIHLEKLLVNSTLNFEPVVNFPEVTLQYLNGDVKRRMYEDGRDYPTSFGMIYPDDRRIIADNEVSVRCARWYEQTSGVLTSSL